jgi:hypothetical protein
MAHPLAAGATHWTPTNEPLEGGQRAGRVSLAHVTVTVLRNYIEPTVEYPVGMYWGVGVGGYHYHIQHGPFHPSSRGIHAVGGIEYLDLGRRLAVRIEAEIHAAGGPGHRQVWADTVPTVGAAVGISRRF